MGTAGCIAFLFGCMGIVVCVYTVPRMVIDGVLSGSEGILIGAGMVLLIIVAAGLSGVEPAASLALVQLFVLALGTLPYLRYVLRDRGNRTIARQDLERYAKALAKDPSLTPARVALGDTYRELGLYEKAASYYESALDREPENKMAQRGLAECLKLRSIARGETWLCHICSSANDPRSARCLQCETPRARLASTPMVHRVIPWAYGGLGLLSVLLMVLGRLSQFGALAITAVIAGAFYALYGLGRMSDA